MTTTNAHPVSLPNCPAWCDQRPCDEWSQYSDHQIRFHSRQQAMDVGDVLQTIDGPGELYYGVNLTAAERFSINWDTLSVRHELDAPQVQFSIRSKEPDGPFGGQSRWDESMTNLTATQAREIAAALLAGADALDAISAYQS